MVDEVAADGVVLAYRDGDFELGAHAVDTGDENGVLEAGQAVQREHSAEAADIVQDAGGESGADMFAHAQDGFIRRIDVHACVAVSDSFFWHDVDSGAVYAPEGI